MDAILGNFRLQDEIDRLQPADDRSGRRAETLIKTDQLRVVLVTMRSGAELQEHTAPGPITIQTLAGSFDVEIGGETRRLGSGVLISLQGGARHAVRAIEDGAFLLTISWLPGDKSDAAVANGDEELGTQGG